MQIVCPSERGDFFRPCFFSEAKKVKERFKVVVVGGGSDRWASPASVYPVA